MKRAALFVLLLFVGAGCFVWLSAVLADGPADPPEFFFTRLAYRENPTGCCRHNYRGFRGFRIPTMPIPPQYVCPEFGGKNFFPPQGWGWGTDYPGGDCKFMGGIHRLTGMHVSPNPNILAPLDPDLFKYPFIYAVEPGGMYFTDEEAARIREYLLRGGFFYLDDFWGRRERENFEEQMHKVFPEKQFELLSPKHEIFHTFFDINEILQVPGEGRACYGGPGWEVPDEIDPRVYAMTDDKGRVMVVATYNSDYGDAWEYMDEACYPEKFSGEAYRIGLNFMIYAMSH
jgi:uncharacterized protein DUF4159